MRKLLCFLLILITTSASFAQVQQGVVRTPGRENKPSTKVENVIIRLVGAHNEEKSDANGVFSLSLGSNTKNNTFQIGSVRRAGYTLFDKGIKFPKVYPISDVPIEIVVIKTEDLEREKQEWEDRGYKYAEREYKKKLTALQKQYQTSEEEYNRRLNELEEWYSTYQSQVVGMAEYYVHVDFDKLDEGLSQITKAIAEGEYELADSLINVYAPNLDNEVEQSIKAKEANREQKAFGASIVAKAIADSIEIAKKDERTASYLYAKYTTAVSDNRWDDALHCLKLRADLDTTNVDAVFEYAELCKDQKKFSECETYYWIVLRAKKQMFLQDTVAYREDLAGTQNNLGNLYSDLHDDANSENYYLLALENYELLFKQNPDAYRAYLAAVQNNLGILYKDFSDYANGEKYQQKALENKELLFKQNPEAYRETLALSYFNIMPLYADMNVMESYDLYLAKAQELYFALYSFQPDKYKKDIIILQNRTIWRLLAKGRVDDALDLAKQTYAMDKSNKLSRSYLGKCYNSKSYEFAEVSDFVNAHATIDKAITLMPENADFYDSKGEFLLMQGQNEEALKMWEKVLELNPNILDRYPNGTNLSNGLKKLGLIE